MQFGEVLFLSLLRNLQSPRTVSEAADLYHLFGEGPKLDKICMHIHILAMTAVPCASREVLDKECRNRQ